LKIRIEESCLKKIKGDLARPCEISYERVGFVFGNLLNGEIVLNEYMPISEQDYEHSNSFGAIFNKNAIKKALGHILKTKKSCFQIHEHSKVFGSQFSQVDIETAIELCQSFHTFNTDMPHGSIVLCGKEMNVYFIDQLGNTDFILIGGNDERL